MMAITPHPAVAAQGTVHRFRRADREALDGGTKACSDVGFHEKVNMVTLHAEVQQAEAVAGRRTECRAYGSEESIAAE
jgi:hypothetical protein